jgi:uncharacterized protein
MKTPTLDDLRRHAVARSLFKPTTLPKAVSRLGFVQADPIRAPARAQDLTLRHRVLGYEAGDLERRYERLGLEEDFFINYGFMPAAAHALMHPRQPRQAGTPWTAERWAQAEAVLAFIQEHGAVHPREVDAHFQHGKSKNWFGGNSNASTQLLDGLHYRGLLRVAGRDSGVRTYALRAQPTEPGDPAAALDALADLVIGVYAPLPELSLNMVVSRLRYGAPQWADACRAALARAKARLPCAEVDGVRWFWPEGENPRSARHRIDEELRLLAPFDPVVWDRRRFEAFWGWGYRFEAYTPAPQRVRGYYALPLLWRGAVIGWANAAVADGRLRVQTGYVSGRAPREPAFRAALEAESARLAAFLRVQPP